MGPLEMMYSWQALICATACVGLTQLTKAVLDVSMGAEKRKASRWLGVVVLPALPVVFGVGYAVLVPLRPEVLLGYINQHVQEGWAWQAAAFGAWGAACGQFATTLFDRLKAALQKGA
jgi:hypothetical protein